MNQSDATHFSSDRLVIKRDGNVIPFDEQKIRAAVTNAFLKDQNGNPWQIGKSALSHAERDKVEAVTAQVVKALSRQPTRATHIEEIQDQVELALMRLGESSVARGYVLYREKQSQKRELQGSESHPANNKVFRLSDGTMVSHTDLLKQVSTACTGLVDADGEKIVEATLKSLFDGMNREDVNKALLLEARTLMETDPAYGLVTARLLQSKIFSEVVGHEVAAQDVATVYRDRFAGFIRKGVDADLLDDRLLQFDLEKLADALEPNRDMQFGYIGLQTLYDRYFLHIQGARIEMGQWFFMRVAMGLAVNEVDREARAIEFYNLLSSFDFMSSTPTLFNSGTRRPQLSSCYLTTVPDDLDGIYESIKDNALLAKYAGGLGNDWTPVRALGSHIKGTNGKSQGIVPFLKVVNDTAVAVNQGGKRKGAVCAYLETWHLDIEEFLDLRKNTGDDRRRTHDMNTANWIPDLFMKRVMEKANWTLFSPAETPDLHDKFGKAFEEAYLGYEAKASRGEMRQFKTIPAVDLWRKMLSMLFETGHPWITFKDPCNVRSPQQHVGVVHSSNLCTEITLNTNDSEIAVCNLGSVNLPGHIKDGKLDHAKLQKTIRTAMRMLDNVIDINYYAVKKARDSNLRHRPVGLGIMGFQDCLHLMRVPYASMEAVEFADRSMEAVCYYAYWASTELAEERGRYSSYRGSLWDHGILPQDSLKMLAEERGGYLEVDMSETMDWATLRDRIKTHGMRNSNCVAIAPTATISNIIDVSASIEPSYQQLYVKSNLSGEFIEINRYLVEDLKSLGMWDAVMVSDLKYFDGSLARIERVPADLKALYATAFEVDPVWLVEAAARRQKWIDQAQSLNIYLAAPSGKKLDELYKRAWKRGVKTTYYLRTLAASHIEKSTSASGTLNAVAPTSATAPAVEFVPTDDSPGRVCMLRPGDAGFEECEACQ